jgi:hypothetical protein
VTYDHLLFPRTRELSGIGELCPIDATAPIDPEPEHSSPKWRHFSCIESAFMDVAIFLVGMALLVAILGLGMR